MKVLSRMVARAEGDVFRRESVIPAAALLGGSPCRNPHGNLRARRLGDADRDRDRFVAGIGLFHPARRSTREEDAQVVVPEGYRMFVVGNRPAFRQVPRERQNDALAPLAPIVIDARQSQGRTRSVCRYPQGCRINPVNLHSPLPFRSTRHST